MDYSDHDSQSCAICLDGLVFDENSPSLPNAQSNKIGAVVPCGHVFHKACWRRWYSAHKRRRSAAAAAGQETEAEDEKCKCPMCNVPCDNFVELFLDGNATSKTTTTATHDGSSSLGVGTMEEDESIVLLAQTCQDSAKRLDHVKSKLQRYKKENKSLETKLQEERRHNKETMDRTLEKHAKERRAWKRHQARLQGELKEERQIQESLQQQLAQQTEEMEQQKQRSKSKFKKLEQKLVDELKQNVAQQAEHFKEWGEERTGLQSELEATQTENEAMRQEIDRTIELQVAERRSREDHIKDLVAQLDKARQDKAKAESKVQKAIEGIAQMRVYHEIRKDQMEQLVAEKAALQEELRAMKEAGETNEQTDEVLFNDETCGN